MTKRILYLGIDPVHSFPGPHFPLVQVIHWPIIRIVPRPLTNPDLSQALRCFDSYTHLIITSKSAVFILQDYLPQLGIHLEQWAEKITIAIGKITAKHLEFCGIIPAQIAREETAEGIVEELRQINLDKAHLFWPHSSQSRSLIKDFLTERNITHTECPLYDTVPHLPGPLPNLDTFDEIIFTSPSTVDAFLKFFGSFPSHPQLTPIGPITAQYLEDVLFLPN